MSTNVTVMFAVIDAAAVALLCACTGCNSRKSDAWSRPGVGEQHVVALPDTPEFLSEDTALSVARGALTFDRLDSASWHPMRDDRTAAPDGRKDQFMARNSINPNRGVFTFTNGDSTRFISVELQSNLIFFQCSVSK